MTHPTRPMRRLHLGAWGASLFVALLVLVAANHLRDQARREHTDNVKDLAQSVSLRLDAWVGTIDYVLQVSADEIEHQTAGHAADAVAITRFLSHQQDRFPHIDLLRATNAQGEAIWGRGVDPAQRASLAQRDYFKRLRDDPKLGLVIAEPVIGRISQQWIWLMARRINAPDGSFAGLVYASMFIRDLTQMLQQSNHLPAGGTIVLRDARMRVVAGSGSGAAVPSVAASAAAGSPVPTEADARHLQALAAARQAQPAAGTYIGPAPDEAGTPTLYAYWHNPSYGYTLLVGEPLAATEVAWRSQALALAGVLAVALMGVFFFVKATTRGWEQAALADALVVREREHGLLKSLIRTIPDLVWVKDPQGVYLACNAEFERYMGRSEAQLLGRSDHDLMDRDLAESFRANDLKALASGRPTVNEEWVTYASDGRRALLKTTKAPLHGPGGAVTGVLGIAHEITEQRRAEDALRESEGKLHQANAELEARVAGRTAELVSVNQQLQDTLFAMEAVGIGILWVDFETGRFVRANRYVAELLGHTREEMLQLTVSDIDPNFPPPVYARARHRVMTEGHMRFETDYLTRDGRRIPMEMSIYHHHRDPQAKPRLIAFASSIADRKRAEREVLEAKAAAEDANRAKSAFLANMSHEIRTPLNALLGLSHLLRGDPLSPTQRERLDKMDGAGRHLLSIINDILDLSKVEAGRLQIETANFHLSAVLDNVYSLVSDAAASKGLRLEVDPDGVPLWLRGDATRLRQSLLNFAGNAVKFTDRGQVVLRALLLQDRGEDLLVRFEVQDSGPGLDEAQLARLFQPFEQVDGSSARRHGGTGLGLALNKRLVELMGGAIGVDSQPGRGSTFWFEVPLQRGHGPMPEPGRTLPQDGAEDRLRLQHRGARVLLAEDNDINVEVVQEMLHAVGLDVVVAGNGRLAVERAAQGAFDLMLMDMQMPEMDGLEATRRIRRMDEHAATPILALTANAFTDDRQACMEAGMDAMLTKPVDPALLYETLLQWLTRGSERRAAPVAPRPPVATASPAAEAALQRLRQGGGFDFDGVRRRVPGQADRLVGLLRRFVTQHAQDPALAQAEHAAGSRGAARERMHRMRGAASLLGLTVLDAESARIEDALKGEAEGPGEAGVVADAVTALEQALRALAQALDGPAPTT